MNQFKTATTLMGRKPVNYRCGFDSLGNRHWDEVRSSKSFKGKWYFERKSGGSWIAQGELSDYDMEPKKS